MVELADAVIAKVAVSRLRWAENQACLAKFHLSERCVTESRPVRGLTLGDQV